MKTIADFYQKFGWTQGAFYRGEHGNWCEPSQATKCCLVGAVEIIAFNFFVNTKATRFIESTIRKRLEERIATLTPKPLSIIDFNDKLCKTKEEMLEYVGDIRFDDILPKEAQTCEL